MGVYCLTVKLGLQVFLKKVATESSSISVSHRLTALLWGVGGVTLERVMIANS